MRDDPPTRQRFPAPQRSCGAGRAIHPTTKTNRGTMLNRLYAALLAAAGLSFGDYIALEDAVSDPGDPPRTVTDPTITAHPLL